RAAPSPEPAWAVQLASFQMKDGALHLEDRTTKPAARVELTPISFTASGAGTDLSKPVQVQFEAGINGKGALKATGTVTPATQAAEVKFALTTLALPQLAPYILPFPALTLKTGSADASGTVSLSGGPKSALRFAGEAAIRDLGIFQKANNSA